jgi:hypothetical protein
VTKEENRLLVDNFSEEEVKKALFQMKHNQSPDPDGFLAEFYQVFLDVIKGVLMALFHEFHQDSLPLIQSQLRYYYFVTKVCRGFKNSAIWTYLPPQCGLQGFYKIVDQSPHIGSS